VLDLSLVGFACRDDAHGAMLGGVDHHEQALFDLAHQLIALFAVAVPGIGLNDAIRVEEGSGGVSEIKPAFLKSRFTLASSHSKFIIECGPLAYFLQLTVNSAFGV